MARLGALTTCSPDRGGCTPSLCLSSLQLFLCIVCRINQRQSNLGLASSTPSGPTSVLAIMSIGHGMAAALQQFNPLCCAKNTCSALLPVARTARGFTITAL